MLCCALQYGLPAGQAGSGHDGQLQLLSQPSEHETLRAHPVLSPQDKGGSKG